MGQKQGCVVIYFIVECGIPQGFNLGPSSKLPMLTMKNNQPPLSVTMCPTTLAHKLDLISTIFCILYQLAWGGG